jgi:uncharacterized membrane protein (UPF0182 family)
LEIFPNPLNEYTDISFRLAAHAHTDLSIYNMSGSMLVILINDYLFPGRYSVAWNGDDAQGNQLKPVYIIVHCDGEAIRNIKIVIY